MFFRSSLHAKLIRRILLITLIISIIVGGGTLYFELDKIQERIQEKILHLVRADANIFLNKYRTNSSESYDLIHTGFISISLYSQENKLLFSQSVSNIEDIKHDLKKIDHHVKAGKDNTRVLFIHNHIKNHFYVEISMPIKIEDHVNGVINALYRASDAEIDAIYEDIAKNTLEAILIVILVSLTIYPTVLFLEKGFIKKTQRLEEANIDIIKVLGSAIAKRDNDTDAHNYRVTLYALALAKTYNMKSKNVSALLKGAFLHDVGKIGIHDAILLKPAKLSKEEFEHMKQHVRFGMEIVRDIHLLDDAHDVIAYHHERYDGLGYLKGLKGKEIPLNARIFAIADVFDALTSRRPYKEEFSFEKTKEIMMAESGTHFDPILLSKFFEIIKEQYEKIKHIESENLLHELLTKKMKQYI